MYIMSLLFDDTDGRQRRAARNRYRGSVQRDKQNRQARSTRNQERVKRRRRVRYNDARALARNIRAGNMNAIARRYGMNAEELRVLLNQIIELLGSDISRNLVTFVTIVSLVNVFAPELVNYRIMLQNPTNYTVYLQNDMLPLVEEYVEATPDEEQVDVSMLGKILNAVFNYDLPQNMWQVRA